ncbi:hypothetical protein C1701_05075 [Actinoalloteichus sp. AHMU CJ021]|nr:hypothetical protein C1701_05075 [Actinoalloteichus sp. AHMU CJ021]
MAARGRRRGGGGNPAAAARPEPGTEPCLRRRPVARAPDEPGPLGGGGGPTGGVGGPGGRLHPPR